MGGHRVGIYWVLERTRAQLPHLSPNQAVLLCLLDLLPVLERGQRHQGHGRATSPWDQVLQLVLTHMEAEHRLALRRVYAGTLPAFVTR